MEFNLLDTTQEIPPAAVVDIARALEELTQHPSWPLFVQLARRRKMERVLADVRSDAAAAPLAAGVDSGVEMLLAMAADFRSWANDLQESLKLQQEAFHRQHLAEHEPNLST